MTDSVIKMVPAIEGDYGTVNCKESSNNPRLKALQKRIISVRTVCVLVVN